jgi:hypothetical protein
MDVGFTRRRTPAVLAHPCCAPASAVPRVRFVSLRAVVALVVVLLTGLVAPAGAVAPVFHGALGIRPALGGFQKNTGVASLRVKNWNLVLTPNSNGIYPTQEGVIIAIGSTEQLVVPASLIHASRSGSRFTYSDPKTSRGVRMFQLRQYGNCPGKACYHVAFTLVGIDLSTLVLSYPFCSPMAIIVGDDDGFSGVQFDRPGGFNGSRVKIDGICNPGSGWPWLNN